MGMTISQACPVRRQNVTALPGYPPHAAERLSRRARRALTVGDCARELLACAGLRPGPGGWRGRVLRPGLPLSPGGTLCPGETLCPGGTLCPGYTLWPGATLGP